MSTLTQKLYCLDSNLTNLPNFTKLFQNLLVSSQNIHQPIQNLTIFEKTYLCSTCPNFNCNCQNQFNCKKIYLFYKYLWFLWESNSFRSSGSLFKNEDIQSLKEKIIKNDEDFNHLIKMSQVGLEDKPDYHHAYEFTAELYMLCSKNLPDQLIEKLLYSCSSSNLAFFKNSLDRFEVQESHLKIFINFLNFEERREGVEDMKKLRTHSLKAVVSRWTPNLD